MDPAVSAALIYGGTQLAAGGASMAATAKLNKKNRRWQERMYNIQRDDEKIRRNEINEYNSPANQMQRFKDAGLNPHLIVGQTNTSAPAQGSDIPSVSGQTPVDMSFLAEAGGKGLQAYQSIEQHRTGMDIRHQELKNMQAQEDSIKFGNLVKLLTVDEKTLSNKLALQTYEYALEKAKADTEGVQLKNSKVLQEIESMKSRDNNAVIDLNIKALEYARKLTDSQHNHKLIDQRIKNLKSDNKYREQQIDAFGREMDSKYWLEDAIVSTGLPKEIGETVGEYLKGFADKVRGKTKPKNYKPKDGKEYQGNMLKKYQPNSLLFKKQ